MFLLDTNRILAYQKRIERVNFFARWVVLSLDAESTAAFARCRSQGIRINQQWRIVFRWKDGTAADVQITDYH